MDFVRTQAPEPRQRLRRALRDLGSEKGNVKALEGPLGDYFRVLIGPFRVVLRYAAPKTIECIFIERRNLVYEVFAETLAERLLGGNED